MDKKPLEALMNVDIEFTANVKARELRFDEVPETKVRFWGHPKHDSVSSTERKNLPDEVQQGATYCDISVKLRIASALIATEAGAFGEVNEE